jgi:glucosamine-phosphate N-acetyltransferase
MEFSPVSGYLIMGTDVCIRELTALDLSHGFLESLGRLAEVNLSLEEAREVFRQRLRTGLRTFVAMEGDQVVGTVTLRVEQKFIHQGGRCGHVEDVVVHSASKQQGIGTALVRHAIQEARALGCYKVILNCFENLVPFYERAGFRRHDVGMRMDL